MGLLKFLGGKSASDHESTGDALTRDKIWGEAKLAFEAALDKLAKQTPEDPAMQFRLRDKLQRTKESLALAQRKEAEELMEAGCMVDAHELLTLAFELTSDPQLKDELTQQMQQTEYQEASSIQYDVDNLGTLPDESQAEAYQEDPDDYFNVLLGALPDDIQQAYRRYGYNFKQGYLALNQGDFDQAVAYLIKAAGDNPSPQSLVPLELATAYVNLGQTDEARVLLEDIVQNQQELLPAFQLLCEIYWENKDFEKALLLLDALAPELSQSMGAYILRGETLLQAGRDDEAKTFFDDLLQTYGWDDSIALGLAKSHEALNETDQARDVYGKLIAQCSGCGTRIDPSIKRKYADLSLAAGNYTTEVLEYYLSLSQEDPANAAIYSQNISRIYAALGNDAESKRFKAIAEVMSRNTDRQ